jgi:hypothetical protein
MPNRENLFMTPPGPKGAPPRPKAPPVEDEEIPDETDQLVEEEGIEPQEEQPRSLEDRLGATGVILLAVLAAVITWLLMSVFMPKP